MTQPRMKLPPQRPTPRPAFYAGPTVSDVLARLRAANVDDGLIEAYLREERLRSLDRLRVADVDPGLIEAYLREERLRSLVRRGTTLPEAIALIKTAFRDVRAIFSPDGNAQIAYALAGPSKGDCE